MNRQTRKRWAVATAAFILAATLSGFAQAQQNQQQPPAEYYQLMGQANYAFKHAGNKADYEEAVKLFQQAVNAAPWLPDTYYDLGKAQQNAEQFSDAIGSLQRYLQLKPDANDRDKVNAEIEELQGEAKQAAAQPAIEQQNQQQSDADFIASLNGAVYEFDQGDYINGEPMSKNVITIRGHQIILSGCNYGNCIAEGVTLDIEGRQATKESHGPACNELATATGNPTTSPCGEVFLISRDRIVEAWTMNGVRVPDDTWAPNGAPGGGHDLLSRHF